MSFAIDLFCGAGGASLGLLRAGYEVVGIDKWRPACRTHMAAGMPVIQADLGTYPFRGSCDLLWASPPCQPFSPQGHRAGQYDPRDGVPMWLRALRELRPAVSIMENVAGLTHKTHGDYLGQVLHDARAAGYSVGSAVLNAADYGVPQERDRLIVVARRDGGPISWPTPSHTDQPGLFTEGWRGMASVIDRPGWRLEPGAELRGNWHSPYPRDLARPAPTIYFGNASWRWHNPASGERVNMTASEAGRLQGFPPGYPFSGTQKDVFLQIGNAVPPAMAEALGSMYVSAPSGYTGTNCLARICHRPPD